MHSKSKTENDAMAAAAPAAGDGEVEGTEGTPLTIQCHRRRSSTSRRVRLRSSASSRLLRMISRAFSISGASEVSQYDRDEIDHDSAEFDIWRQKEQSSTVTCCQQRQNIACIFTVSACVTFAAVILLILLVSSPSHTFIDGMHVISHAQDLNRDIGGGICHPIDGIQALKTSSYIDGLENGAVASDNPICSKIGRDILLDDGNAVDAAVATILCLGVVNPASSGLGGGAFLLIRSNQTHFEQKDASTFPDFIDERDNKIPDESSEWMVEVVDCRETAPGRAHEDMYSDESGVPDTASAIGGLAVATPGELRGLELAHARHGRLSWSDVVEPARKLAHDGFPVSPTLAFEINLTMALFDRFGDYPTLRSHLSRHQKSKNGPLQEGDIFKNPGLAATLAAVAELGADAIYKGKAATSIVDDVQNNGGILTVEDLGDYKPVLRSPVYAEASGFNIVGVPPPSSGGAVLIGALRFLSGFQSPFAGAGSADSLSVHRMVEALRHVFAIRMSLADPSEIFGNSSVTKEAVHDLLTGDYMESLRSLSRDNDTLPLSSYGGHKWAKLHDDDTSKTVKDAHEGDRRNIRRLAGRPFGYLEDSGTSHLSVVDKHGNSVAVTSSVNGIFGSLVFSESTGILLGNTMDDFSVPSKGNFFGLTPSEANFIKPGKRPLSSMSPTMIFRRPDQEESGSWGDLILTIGGSGGPKIITAVLQVLINVLLLGMPLFEGMAHPRVHDQLLYHGAAVTATERMVLTQGITLEVSNRTKNALLKRGHHELLEIDYTGCVQAIFFDCETRTLSAVSDIRKGGSPSGY